MSTLTRRSGNYSTRVDKVGLRPRLVRTIRALVTILIAITLLIPVVWMGMTAFKSRADAVASPPKLVFEPTLEGLVSLLTTRRQLTADLFSEVF